MPGSVVMMPGSKASEATLLFTWLRNHLGDKEDVLAVTAATHDLGAPAASTRLIASPKGNNNAISLEIGGSNTEYILAPDATSANK